MPFRPAVGEVLDINGVAYQVAPHPQSPNYPFAQEGGRATVYRLDAPHTAKALKVFKQLYRTSHVVATTTQLTQYATLAGLGVCNREVLIPAPDGTPPLNEPELAWAVLMPWMEGSTWYDILIETDQRKRAIDLTIMRPVVQKFLYILLEMELNAVTHCDLSPGNVLVQFWPPDVALIDIEEICASGVPMPEILPKGTPGYAHRSASDGLWHPFADRFAGAILLCEMMCWSDEFFRSQVHGDSFFDPAEMHQNTPRYQVMYHTLTKVGGIGLAQLFERCWFAPQLSETPAFWEWARGMHEYFRKSVLTQPPVQTKLHAQIDHTLQELQRRLQHTKEIDDTSALSYLRLYQRMEYELAKFTVVGNTGSSSQFSHTQALKKTRLSSPVDSLMPTFHQLSASTWFVVITIIAMIIAGYVVFGVRPTTTTQTILPQIFVTVLPNNETLTPSYTVVPIHTNTRIAIQISTVTIMPTNTSTPVATVQLIRTQTEIPTITASETVTMPPTLPPTELPTLPPTIAPTQTIAPVQTGSVDVAVQFEIGSRPQTFEISPAGRNMWMDYSNRLTIDVCPSSRLEKDKHPSFRIPVYDNSYLVDFRVNGAVVWQNIKLEEVVNGRLLDRRLVILGYDNGPVIVGYIDKFDNSLYRC